MASLRVKLLFLAALCLSCAPALAVECAAIEHATVCRVDVSREHLQLFLRDDQGAPFSTFAAIDRWLKPRGRHLAFAMNAGMYRPDYSPSGLFVAEGHQLAPLETRRGHGNFFLKPNGVFLVSDRCAKVVADQPEPLMLHRPHSSSAQR